MWALLWRSRWRQEGFVVVHWTARVLGTDGFVQGGAFSKGLGVEFARRVLQEDVSLQNQE